jgi:hypothetical protein
MNGFKSFDIKFRIMSSLTYFSKFLGNLLVILNPQVMRVYWKRVFFVYLVFVNHVTAIYLLYRFMTHAMYLWSLVTIIFLKLIRKFKIITHINLSIQVFILVMFLFIFWIDKS